VIEWSAINDWLINKSFLVNAVNFIEAFTKSQNGKEKESEKESEKDSEKEKKINFLPPFPTTK